MTVFRLRGDALDWVETGHEIVALDNRGAVYLSANSTGTFLWRMLVSGATRGELVGELASRFAIEVDRAGRDVDAFLEQLDTAGLLAPYA